MGIGWGSGPQLPASPFSLGAATMGAGQGIGRGFSFGRSGEISKCRRSQIV